jgi:NodT family efflux transporter outer membrane factor (OMF) lipoprotein
MKRLGRRLAVVLVIGVQGCAVGPDYRYPELTMPDAWAQRDQVGVTSAPADLAGWWRRFGDPVLDTLIDRAIAKNLDLKIALANVREARALRGVAGADQFPAVNASGAYSRVKDSENARPLPPGFDPEHHLFLVGLDASWELDIWGRVRRSVEAAGATLEATEDNRRDVLVIVMAEVARNLVEVRSTQQRLLIAQDNIRAQQEVVDLTRARFDAGLATHVEVSQARALLATTQAQVPALQVSRDQTIHRLAVLVADAPANLLSELRQIGPIPAAPPSVPIDLPSDLVRRRPDVRRVERELAASTARIGVATADLFPRFSLTGTLGVAATDAAKVFTGASRFSSIGPQVVWPIFAGGRIRANIRVQEARQEAALAHYERTVLDAIEETENALVAYGEEHTRQQRLAEAVEASQDALTLSRELYLRGLVDFLTVLDNQRSLYVAQDQRVQSERTLVVSLIALYKALGGGWEPMEIQP